MVTTGRKGCNNLRYEIKNGVHSIYIALEVMDKNGQSPTLTFLLCYRQQTTVDEFEQRKSYISSFIIKMKISILALGLSHAKTDRTIFDCLQKPARKYTIVI